MAQVLGYSFAIEPEKVSSLETYKQAYADVKRSREKRGGYSTFLTRGQTVRGEDVLGFYGRTPGYKPPSAVLSQVFDIPKDIVNPGIFSGAIGRLANPGGTTQRYITDELKTTRGKQFIFSTEFANFLEGASAKQDPQYQFKPFTGVKTKKYAYATGNRRKSEVTLTTPEYTQYLNRIANQLFTPEELAFRTNRNTTNYIYRGTIGRQDAAFQGSDITIGSPEPEYQSALENLEDKVKGVGSRIGGAVDDAMDDIADFFGW